MDQTALVHRRARLRLALRALMGVMASGAVGEVLGVGALAATDLAVVVAQAAHQASAAAMAGC